MGSLILEFVQKINQASTLLTWWLASDLWYAVIYEFFLLKKIYQNDINIIILKKKSKIMIIELYEVNKLN